MTVPACRAWTMPTATRNGWRPARSAMALVIGVALAFALAGPAAVQAEVDPAKAETPAVPLSKLIEDTKAAEKPQAAPDKAADKPKVDKTDKDKKAADRPKAEKADKDKKAADKPKADKADKDAAKPGAEPAKPAADAAKPGAAAPVVTKSNTPPPPPEKPFGFADVRAKAKALADAAYDSGVDDLPDVLKNLSYDQYRDIRFKADSALWRYDNLPFQVQFYHRGFLFQKPVRINAIVDGRALPIRYSPDLFDFGKTPLAEVPPADLGFAGFRLHYPLKQPDYYDEVAVFLGASYFRAVGARNHYGLSARGLALDTGLPRKEEFPLFREFWIQKPQPADSQLVVYALLDSPSVAGAYRFVIHPSLQTTMDVTAHLFIRREINKFGVAPLTSMFFHGENGPATPDDFRPEAHDSDGLLIDSGGEWIWRPLINPGRLQLSSFHAVDPRGFGLLQRDRNYDHYQDLESAYEDRPSLWVSPVGNWGEGDVHLIEIPVDADKYDNIVAFWWPREPFKAGEEHVFAYKLNFTSDMLNRPPLGRVTSTHVGAAPHNKDHRQFVLEFERVKDPGPDGLQAAVSTSAGQVLNLVTYRNARTRGWRVSFELAPEGDKPIELRGYLKVGEEALSETWSYQWNR